jgi:hypothetical protein
VAALDSAPEIGLNVGGWRYIDSAGHTLSEWRPWQDSNARLDLHAWIFGCAFVPHAPVIRRAWIERIGGFDLSFRRGEDWDLWLRLAYAGCQMQWIEEVVCCYRLHGSNMTRDAASQTRAQVRMLDNFFSTPGMTDELRQLAPSAYAQVYLRGVPQEFGADQITEAAADLERAVTLDPGLLTERRGQLLHWVVTHAMHPFTSDPLRYIATVYDHLPRAARSLAVQRREAMTQVALARLFSAYHAGDLAATRTWLVRAIAIRPVPTLLDRGVLSAAAEAILGRTLSAVLRSAARGRRQTAATN